MRRWTRRVLIILTLFLLSVLLFLGATLALYKGTPDWYVVSMEPQRRAAAAMGAEEKITQTQNWAALLQGDAVRAARATQQARPAPATRVSDVHEVRFTQDELNALFEKWSSLYGWDSKYGQYLAEPRVILHPGRLIIAAKVTDLGTVASFHFAPAMDDRGKLHLDLVKVLGGRLPLPNALWDSYKQRLVESLNRWMPRWRAGAVIDARGAANGPAMYATLSAFVLNISRNEGGEPILFLPLLDNAKSLPVKVMRFSIDQDALVLKVRKLTPRERDELLKKIRSNSQINEAKLQ
jgi:hypothetical protein